MDMYRGAVDLATNPKHTRWLSPVLIAAETILCAGIIWKVPYTEIDWTTYMQQVTLFVNGETNYYLIKGDTGPLVYPAFHVYLYSALYYLTDHGTNIFRAQCIFAVLYLTTVAVVLACYRRAGAPPWLLVPLVLSKRLHSIFLLRLFNDGWATLALWVSIYGLQRQNWVLGAIAWGIGLGIKMTLLLAAPALVLILVQGAGSAEAFFLLAYQIVIQAAASFPFVSAPSAGFGYFFQAFDFGRQFLYKWTVNWRFVGEDVFQSRAFSNGLLAVHASLLLSMMQTRWTRPSSTTSIPAFAKKYLTTVSEAEESRITSRITPVFVMDTMLASVAIGLLCARSLHYQFYAYLGWASPYLLWRAGGGPLWVAVVWAAQEYCWLIYPSTNMSSAVVVLALALQVASVYIAPAVESKSSAQSTEVGPHSE